MRARALVVSLLCVLLPVLVTAPASAQEAAPGCYGTVHNDPADGSPLDGATFALLHDCVQDRPDTWAFDVATYDAWDSSLLKELSLRVDADGSAATGCDGLEWHAYGFHSPQTGLSAALYRTPDCSRNELIKGLEIQHFEGDRVVMLVQNVDLGGPTTVRWHGRIQAAGEHAAERLPKAGDLTESGWAGATGDGCTPAAEDRWVVPGGPLVAQQARAAGARDVQHRRGLVTFTGRAAAVQRALDRTEPGLIVEPDMELAPVDVPDDPLLPQQWELAAVKAQPAWDVTTGSRSVVVGVVDTGFDGTHPELQGVLLPGYDATTGTALTSNADPRNHGTFVAGQIAALTDNGAGVASLGRHTSVLPVKVLRDGDSAPQVSAVASGIRWAADNGADVINISLAGCGLADVLTDAVAYAQSRGVLVVAGAGNAFDKGNAVQYPAALPGVVAVGAVTRELGHAGYSSTGDYVDMVAPGGNCDGGTGSVLVLSAGGGTRRTCGTSVSAPLVSAAAALLLAHAPDAAAEQLSQALTASSRDLGVAGRDNVFGHGLLDVPAALQAIRASGLLRPLPPARLLDTRDGTGGTTGRLAPGGTTQLQVTGRGGVPASGVSAVLLNTTAVAPSGSGHLTVFAGGTRTPEASSLNYVRGQTVANLVLVPVGADGTVLLRSSGGTPHALADVLGYFRVDGAAQPPDGAFAPVPPTRLVDSRSSDSSFGRLRTGVPQSFQVAGRGRVPADARAVVLNVTATGATSSGHLTVFPGGQQDVPTASALNFRAGQSVPNLVVVPLGPDGHVQVVSGGGQPDVLADVVGYYAPPGSAGRLTPLTPTRLLDSRTTAPNRLDPARSYRVPVAGRAGVPAAGARTVILNVAVTSPLAAGHLTVFPSGSTVPATSNLNYAAGQTVPNLVMVPVGTDGSISLRSNSGTPFVLIDVMGWTT